MIDQLVVIVGITFLVLVSPGPDMILVLRNTLLAGRRAGLQTSLGVLAGNFVHIIEFGSSKAFPIISLIRKAHFFSRRVYDGYYARDISECNARTRTHHDADVRAFLALFRLHAGSSSR